MKHEIMWWMSRLTIMLTSLFLSMTLAAKAYAVDIQMGYEGNLVFEPSEVTVSAGDTVTFINNALPPHNIIVDGRADLSREALMLVQVKHKRLCLLTKETLTLSVHLMRGLA